MTPEPWLRGPIEGLHPVASHLLYTFEQTREELALFTRGIAQEQLWTPVAGASLGFQLRHMAGSIDRLCTYLQGRLLSPEQLAFLKQEADPRGATLDALLQALDETQIACLAVVRSIDPATYLDVRGVGRKALPTTVAGLIIHISEHTQRHLGQAILTAKVVRG